MPFGTKLQLTYRGRGVVVVVNDIGKGKTGENRVLDLSRAAMAYLTDWETAELTDVNAGVIALDGIFQMNDGTSVGPCNP